MSDKDMFECAYQEYQVLRPSSTFWSDFSIADRFGLTAINDTFSRAFNEWKTDYKMFAELVSVLNHKIWQHYQNSEAIAELYNRLWMIADEYWKDNFSDEELCYIWHVLD